MLMLISALFIYYHTTKLICTLVLGNSDEDEMDQIDDQVHIQDEMNQIEGQVHNDEIPQRRDWEVSV